MAFIELMADPAADEPAAGLFARDLQTIGYVANLTRLFARRPAVYQSWAQLNKAIKANMDVRVYELATLAAAVELLCAGARHGAARPVL
jgi:alkylhydroperoxidase/carboxymuconolactone decarboxylase family protein YurZ